MTIYVFTSGEYSDYSICGLVEGPSQVDAPTQSRMRERIAEMKLGKYDSEKWMRVLIEEFGFKEVDWSEENGSWIPGTEVPQ